MKQVRANCRERFSANDLEFVAATLSSPDKKSALEDLLCDPEALNAALDSDRLLKSILEMPGNIPVTPQFYFYVLTRHMLRQFDRSVADYVASVLAGFVDIEHRGATAHLPYISDMLIALQSASSEREFLIRAQVGNYSLFLAGIFPEYIDRKSVV